VRAGDAPGDARERGRAGERRAAALDPQVGKAAADAGAVLLERRDAAERLDRERVLVVDLGAAAVGEGGIAVPGREPARRQVVDPLQLCGQDSSGMPSRGEDACA
jgi:hypothetical protein